MDELIISHGVYNTLQESVDKVREYAAVGVDQLVVSLVGPTLHDMREQLEWFGASFVGCC